MENFPSIYIDGNNLYRGAKDLGYHLDYKKLRGWLRQKYNAKEAYIFIGYIESRKDYYKYLENCDYKLIFKKVVSVGTQIKGNCDAELVLKVVSDFYLKKFNKCIITGDGDFGCLVEFLKENNAIYKIISPDFAKCSILLRDKNIDIDFLNNHYHKFLSNEKAPTADLSAEGSLS